MYIHVKAIAGASKEKFKQKSPDHFEISVKEKAERNAANERILALLSLHFKVAVGKIHIVNGHRSPSKLLEVEN